VLRQFELVEAVKAYDPTADEALLNRAYVYAMKMHGSQLRASGDPYFAHPIQVAGILTDYRLDTATIVTALLHDVVEDTSATRDDIAGMFGEEIASLVEGVTKLSRLAISPQLETPWSLLITGTWVGVVVYCFWSSLAAPYLHPRLRWWTRPPRISLCQEASIVYQGTMIPVTVLNLSRGGAFVRVEDATAEGSAMPRRLGETCRIAMTLGRADQPASDSERFESSAQLVWRGAPETPYRNGLGIKFASLSRSQRHRLNRYLQAFREAECLQPPAKT